jgi:hypothetical protein
LDYALDAGRDVWDFAIEIADLRSAGMTTSDFRWLVSKGFVEHGQETSIYGAPHRCFCRGEGLTFLPASALVLTPLGAAEVRKLLPSPAGTGAGGDGGGAGSQRKSLPVSDFGFRHSDFPPGGEGISLPSATGAGDEGRCDEITKVFLDWHLHAASPSVAAISMPCPPNDEQAARLLRLPLDVKPTWNARSRELRVGELLVKKFRVPAGNQELVLSAFEEEGWPAYIDDPLPMKSEIVPKQRLSNVINRLNGSQLAPVLRFHGDGNGEGIGWQLLHEHSSPKAGSVDRDSAAAASGSVLDVSFDRNRIGTRST